LRIIKWGQLVELIEVVLLHELTHWTDDRDYRDYTGKAVEEGALFEEIVYRQVIDNRSAEKYWY
jgi:hypothetical protein